MPPLPLFSLFYKWPISDLDLLVFGALIVDYMLKGCIKQLGRVTAIPGQEESTYERK